MNGKINLTPSEAVFFKNTMKTLLKTLLISIWPLCVASSQEERSEYVSMFSLVSSPERYEGKFIKIRGYYFMFSPSQQFLYNSIEDHKGRVMKNSLWIYGLPDEVQIPKEYVEKVGKGPPLSNATGSYVTIVGRFKREMIYKTSSMPTGVVEFIFAENVSKPKG
jgi:hypothetical protein